MRSEADGGTGAVDDPVARLLLSGKARTLDEAEEAYLNASLPAIYQLLESPLPDEELCNHPLLALVRARGSRGWEDSL